MERDYLVTNYEAEPWQKAKDVPGVEIKHLGTVNGQTMALYRFEPNTSYPDHHHEDPEFVFMMEGEVIQNGELLKAGWSSAAKKGSPDRNFRSGENGCVFLCVHGKSTY